MKLIEVLANKESDATLRKLADKVKAEDFHALSPTTEDMVWYRMLVGSDQLQTALDTLQNVLGAQPTAKVMVVAAESSWPEDDEKQDREHAATATREALYESVSRGARCNRNYMILTVLSTVVAAIGLMESNVAVVIGAMVIAPLLGPNLALSLGISLGEPGLMRKAGVSLAAGLAVSLLLSVGMGLLLEVPQDSQELLARTDVGFSAAALALASGAAAALSLTTGLSSVLVGVMVAVALLPPLATLGLMMGKAEWGLAGGAGLLLAVNIVCVNLSANVVFLMKNIRPRTWPQQSQARRAMWISLASWTVLLLLLVAAIALKQRGGVLR